MTTGGSPDFGIDPGSSWHEKEISIGSSLGSRADFLSAEDNELIVSLVLIDLSVGDHEKP